MPYLEMKSQVSIAESPADAEDTWSTAARSGSPPPPMRVSRDVVTPTGNTSTTEPPHARSSGADQNVLLGVGSQFAVIDDSALNADILPNL
ncbi:uncharacterized protein TRIREDRAFT_112518 [Trichoderma reesei QM6a]|uniref:Predicted protein n=2 Tax=Hypocrea jecorina TaxID=51453 RepID=G0RX95_HYPJQ|nr:uncharacterized protein TRIREDRAFT_112518 [Trichoderma reesei QM6a]EGR44189.1 predicted protein [Trichoderma reesei QM6a]ETR96830.1 hypothetical protein M419DRAFT_135075 [Trichoderma reesei RUT C-30]